jgi:hypothetical protein
VSREASTDLGRPYAALYFSKMADVVDLTLSSGGEAENAPPKRQRLSAGPAQVGQGGGWGDRALLPAPCSPPSAPRLLAAPLQQQGRVKREAGRVKRDSGRATPSAAAHVLELEEDGLAIVEDPSQRNAGQAEDSVTLGDDEDLVVVGATGQVRALELPARPQPHRPPACLLAAPGRPPGRHH